MIIKPLKQIVFRVNLETGEKQAPKQEKSYLLLLYYVDDSVRSSEDNKDFEIILGRRETFDFVLRNLEAIDLLKSHVMSQTVSLEKAITAYTFMRFCLESHMSEQEKDELDFGIEALDEYTLNCGDEDTLDEDKLNEIYNEEMNQ